MLTAVLGLSPEPKFEIPHAANEFDGIGAPAGNDGFRRPRMRPIAV